MNREEQEEFFNKNVNLAYKVASCYRSNYFNELEDIIQIALGALWKAVIYYDNSRAMFSTFAVPIIRNDINYYLRRVKKSKKEISINSTIKTKSSSNDDLTLEGILTNDSEDLIEAVEDKIFLENLFSEIQLSNKETEVLRYWLEGKKQTEIAEKLHTSQTDISRTVTRLKRKFIYFKNKKM